MKKNKLKIDSCLWKAAKMLQEVCTFEDEQVIPSHEQDGIESENHIFFGFYCAAVDGDQE